MDETPKIKQTQKRAIVPPEEQEKIDLKQKIYYGLIKSGGSMLFQFQLGALPVFYTDVIMMNPVNYGLVFLLFGIWNAINDPVFGMISDRYEPKAGEGKRSHFIRMSLPLSFIGFTLFWLASPGWSDSAHFWFLLFSLFIFDTGYTLFSLNLAALLSVSTDDSSERTGLSLVSHLVHLIPGGIVGFLPTYLLTSDFSQNIVVFLFCLVGIVGTIMLWYGLRNYNERYVPEPKTEPLGLGKSIIESFKSKSFRYFLIMHFCVGGVALNNGAIFIYYLNYVFDLSGLKAVMPTAIAGVALAIMLPVFKKISDRIGSRNTLLIFITLDAFAYLALYFAQSYIFMIICFSLTSIGTSCLWLYVNPMIADICDEDELKQGRRREGMYFGINALVGKFAPSLVIYIFMYIIQSNGFVANEQQTPQAIEAIRWGQGIMTFLFLVLGIIALILYPLRGEKLKKVKREMVKHRKNKLKNSDSDEKYERCENLKKTHRTC